MPGTVQDQKTGSFWTNIDTISYNAVNAMKRKNWAILFTAMLLIAGSLSAQTGCKVLVPVLEGIYSGDCKAGLADGIGEALGEDYYKGEFVKGYPEGEGTYLWKSGAKYSGEWKKGMRNGKGRYEYTYKEKDLVQEGEWKNDKFIGTKAPQPYVIEYLNGIGRVTCIKVGDRPYIKYRFARAGAETSSLDGLLMQSSSGSEKTSPEFTGYEQVEFPFWGKLTFSAPNAWYSAMIDCEVRLTINQPGAWIVTISY
jgi:hypothetical protein